MNQVEMFTDIEIPKAGQYLVCEKHKIAVPVDNQYLSKMSLVLIRDYADWQIDVPSLPHYYKLPLGYKLITLPHLDMSVRESKPVCILQNGVKVREVPAGEDILEF